MGMLKDIGKYAIPALVLNFFVAYGIKSLHDDIVYPPKTGCVRTVEQQDRLPTSLSGSLFAPNQPVYERIVNQVYRNRIEEIRVDYGGDGTIDDTIVFFTRRTGAILAENAVGIYDGFPVSDNLREKITFPDNLTSNQYKERAREVLSERGYDAGALENFDFF